MLTSTSKKTFSFFPPLQHCVSLYYFSFFILNLRARMILYYKSNIPWSFHFCFLSFMNYRVVVRWDWVVEWENQLKLYWGAYILWPFMNERKTVTHCPQFLTCVSWIKPSLKQSENVFFLYIFTQITFVKIFKCRKIKRE